MGQKKGKWRVALALRLEEIPPPRYFLSSRVRSRVFKGLRARRDKRQRGSTHRSSTLPPQTFQWDGSEMLALVPAPALQLAQLRPRCTNSTMGGSKGISSVGAHPFVKVRASHSLPSPLSALLLPPSPARRR
jgi:hypothetical protein